MKKKNLIAALLALALMFSLAACSGGNNSNDDSAKEPASNNESAETAGDDTVYNWDYLAIISTTNPAMNTIVEFVNEVKEATDGRLVITIREPGELPFTNSEFVRAIGENSAQMGWGLVPSITGDLSSGGIFGLPFLIQDSEDLTKAMGVLEEPLKEELAAYGANILFYFNMPSQNLFGQGDPIESLADVNGMSIRSTGSEMADVIKGLDAIPVTIDSAEVPTSLSRGVVDSVITSALNCYGSNWNESLNWAYMFNLQADTVLTLVNQESLDALPEDIREILLDLSDKYTEKAMKAIADSEEDAINSLEEGGMTFVYADEAEVDAMVEQYADYWTEWAEAKGGNIPQYLADVREALGK